MKRPADVDLHALAARLVPLVAAQIAKMLAGASEPKTYSSRKGCGPAGIPDREWKTIAAKIGRKPYPSARWRVVEREAYENWLAGQSTTAAPANDAAEPWSPRAALASVGLRGSR